MILAELKFQNLLFNFELLRGPIGKGLYCIFLSTFFINDTPDSMMYILNIIIAVIGFLYIFTGLFCKKKNEIEVAPTK